MKETKSCSNCSHCIVCEINSKLARNITAFVDKYQRITNGKVYYGKEHDDFVFSLEQVLAKNCEYYKEW
jgi:hypothetical protein